MPPDKKLPGAPAPAPRIFVGTSGWSYPTWKPGFYPADVSAKKFLNFYAGRLTSVEVNYTFASELKPGQLAGWLDATPPGFRFSFKAPQRLTHYNRLQACDDLLAHFLGSLAPAQAVAKLGAVLFQLPPNFKCDLDRLRTFLAAPALRSPQAPPIAFEFRHASWFAADLGAQVRDMLQAHNVALCIAESDDLQSPEWHTAAAHSCFRLRRNGGYKSREITAFAAHFHSLPKDRDLYIYLKHEDEPTGALNAQALLRALRKLAK